MKYELIDNFLSEEQFRPIYDAFMGMEIFWHCYDGVVMPGDGKIQFVHPPRNNGPTASDGISDTAWKENKDMSGELLTKVKRNNKIMIEFKGNSKITRTD